ncbi:hypothetical protein [Halomonas korlensis]|uniref:Chromosome partition protein Smc n=1 Tax=Halomonas korlensis TaxID=463301 RepID=A0A1I7EY96_9GAMM|nr:hypothetical protein [Halomonas korlensis]SFU28886.1 hypothetical protein SAMN04487955_10189 [Halomonas korlensis]
MAERPEDRRHTRPIVPDPDSSLAPRLRQPPAPRMWPLWLLVLLLLGGCLALAWTGWQERSRFERELTRISGEVSNVHARFDAQQGDGDVLASLESRLEALEARDSAFEKRFEEVQERVESRLPAMDERLDELVTRQTEVVSDGEARDALIASARMSLDALEQVGEEGRAALEERLMAIAEARERDEQRLDTVENELIATLETEQSMLEERLASTQRQLEDFNNRQSQLAEAIESVESSREAEQQRSNATDARLDILEDELAELRRGQLALSAQLEALQP